MKNMSVRKIETCILRTSIILLLYNGKQDVIANEKNATLNNNLMNYAKT